MDSFKEYATRQVIIWLENTQRYYNYVNVLGERAGRASQGSRRGSERSGGDPGARHRRIYKRQCAGSGLAEDVRRQKLEEAQAISEAVLDAEVKIGELMSKVPKNNVGRPSKNIDSAVDILPSKSEVIEQSGFTQKQAERFQTLAKHLDLDGLTHGPEREKGGFIV